MRPSSAARRLKPSLLQPFPSLGISLAQRWRKAMRRLFALMDIAVDVFPMVQVECDRSIDLLQRERSEIPLNRFRTFAPTKSVNDGIQRHASTGDIVAAGANVDVVGAHAFTVLFYRHCLADAPVVPESFQALPALR
jgi:hypothetical protein